MNKLFKAAIIVGSSYAAYVACAVVAASVAKRRRVRPPTEAETQFLNAPERLASRLVHEMMIHKSNELAQTDLSHEEKQQMMKTEGERAVVLGNLLLAMKRGEIKLEDAERLLSA
jgi:hypothetical protein